MPLQITVKKIRNKLTEVMDPELNISIVDLGLIYEVRLIEKKVKIIMTLTTVGCPLFSMIEQDIKGKIVELGIKEKDIILELVFDPPWDMNKMSKKGRALLGI